MDQFYKKYDEERRAIELENTKLKLRMVSRNSKSSKPSVDDYINNILGSGLKINKPTHYNKSESQSAKNINYNDQIYNQYNFNQSCNLQSKIQNGNNNHTDHHVQLPALYQDVIDMAKNSSCELDTSKIYNIFITSGLSQEILGAIWSLINRTSPGQLTQQELTTGLAMIALCQEQLTVHGLNNNINLPTWDQVQSLTDLPVPRITINKPNYQTDHILSDTSSLINQSESGDEWADFSGFVSSDKNPERTAENVSDRNDTLSNDLLTLTDISTITSKHLIEAPSIDIHQVIHKQFSNWQDDIQTDKLFSSNKPEISNGPANNSIFNYATIPVPVTENIDCATVLPPVSDADFGDFQLFDTIRSPSALDNCDGKSRANNLDRYEIFNCDMKGTGDNLIDQWLRCLAQCLKLLASTVSVLKRVEDDAVKIDVFNSEKGVLLLKGIIEVYRVTRNIKLSASRSNILTSSKPMLDELSELEKCWNEFMLIIPDEMQIDVHSKLSRGGHDQRSLTIDDDDDQSSDDLSVTNACGVCLCRLDHDDSGFLSHGLHRYHCPCANLWVNTLDLTLPGLSMPGQSTVL